jgi:hypothetical protein
MKNKPYAGVKAKRLGPYGRHALEKVSVVRGLGPRHAENALEGTDTVPAMLTPREAVLNRNAAELEGRGKIEKLNAMGNKLARKGIDLAQEGESDVDKDRKKLAGTPARVRCGGSCGRIWWGAGGAWCIRQRREDWGCLAQGENPDVLLAGGLGTCVIGRGEFFFFYQGDGRMGGAMAGAHNRPRA